MNVALGIGWSATDIDFWSYASGLDKKVEEDDAKLEETERLEAEREKTEAEKYAMTKGRTSEVVEDR